MRRYENQRVERWSVEADDGAKVGQHTADIKMRKNWLGSEAISNRPRQLAWLVAREPGVYYVLERFFLGAIFSLRIDAYPISGVSRFAMPPFILLAPVFASWESGLLIKPSIIAASVFSR